MSSSSLLPSSDPDDYSGSDPLRTPHLPAIRDLGYISLPDATASSQLSGVNLNLLYQGLVAYSQESATPHPTPTMVRYLNCFKISTRS